ncbi:MAG TPA: response regulator [Chryseolinea sp.]|jgi:CheY-like chemotaxis protein|nr:response regulator [Chryseolinea sp.]
MNRDGEIIIIEDDLDDQEMLFEIFKSLNVVNQVIFFENGQIALEYLEKPDNEPFLIMSDVNMPKLSGFELRERIFTNKELSKKCIPYIFFTTAATKEAVVNAYSFSAQGFFKKPVSYGELKLCIKAIVDYWKLCYSPSDF